jgi:hypothetical protein
VRWQPWATAIEPGQACSHLAQDPRNTTDSSLWPLINGALNWRLPFAVGRSPFTVQLSKRAPPSPTPHSVYRDPRTSTPPWSSTRAARRTCPRARRPRRDAGARGTTATATTARSAGASRARACRAGRGSPRYVTRTAFLRRTGATSPRREVEPPIAARHR